MCAELRCSAEAEPCISFTHLNRSLSCPPHHRHPWPAPRTGDWAAGIKQPARYLQQINHLPTVQRTVRVIRWRKFTVALCLYEFTKHPLKMCAWNNTEQWEKYRFSLFFILKLLIKVLSGLCLRAVPLPPLTPACAHTHTHTYTHTHTHEHRHIHTLILSLIERKINNRKQRRKQTQGKSDLSRWPHGAIFPKTPGLLTSCNFFLACFAKSDKSAVLKQTATLNITQTVCYIQNHINNPPGNLHSFFSLWNSSVPKVLSPRLSLPNEGHSLR